MIDNKTPHLELPLPNLSNQQDEDVPRIAEALAGLDAHAAQSDARIAKAEDELGGAAFQAVELEKSVQAQHYKLEALSADLKEVQATLPGKAESGKYGLVLPGSGLSIATPGKLDVDVADSTRRGIGRVATLADMAPGAEIANGPAMISAGSDVEKLLLRSADKYDVGEFYYFRHPTLKPGFAPLHGGLINGAYQGKNITEYPIWAYLQTTEGQKLCKTEAEWRAMTTATWHTNADGSKVGWGGIGGAPFYVQNLSTGTLRMPDIRGMYAEAAGFDALGVGGVQGDGERRKSGKVGLLFPGGFETSTTAGVFNTSGARSAASGVLSSWGSLEFDNAGSVPIAAKNQPRSWGALACAYLGASS